MTWIDRFGNWYTGMSIVTARYYKAKSLFPIGTPGEIRQKEFSKLAKPWAEMLNAAGRLLQTYTPSIQLYKGQTAEFWRDGLEAQYDSLVDVYNELSAAYQQQKLDDLSFLADVIKYFGGEVDDLAKYLKILLYIGVAIVALNLLSYIPRKR